MWSQYGLFLFGVILFMVRDCVGKGVFRLVRFPGSLGWGTWLVFDCRWSLTKYVEDNRGRPQLGTFDQQTTLFSAFSSTFIFRLHHPEPTIPLAFIHPLASNLQNYQIHCNRFKCKGYYSFRRFLLNTHSLKYVFVFHLQTGDSATHFCMGVSYRVFFYTGPPLKS